MNFKSMFCRKTMKNCIKSETNESDGQKTEVCTCNPLLIEQVRCECDEIIQRLRSEDRPTCRVCQFGSVCEERLCMVVFLNTDIRLLVNNFWSYDRSGDNEMRDITGASIADLIFKDGYRPKNLQGKIEDIDWKDFMAMILPKDYDDFLFLAGYGGRTTVLSLFSEDGYHQGNFDGFYYIEILQNHPGLLPKQSPPTESDRVVFHIRGQFIEKHFHFDQ